MAAGESVACEPRLFVGQVPTTARDDDLWPIFNAFGNVRNLHLLKGSDGKPRGCAMVLYARWAQAEAASQALNGHSTLIAGQSRPLVVHFANPRRSPQGPPEPGIAPRKLFVGQVPKDITEDQLRPYFETCGEIEHINILRTQAGQSAGCAFVQFRTWAQAEAAIDMHNANTRLGNAEVPLVVKFADAKRRDTAGPMGRRPGEWPPSFRRNSLAPGDMGMQGAHGWQGLHEGKLVGQGGTLPDEGYGAGLAGGHGAGDYNSYPGAVGNQGLVSEHALLNSMGLAGNTAGPPAGAYGPPGDVAGNASLPHSLVPGGAAGSYPELLALQAGRLPTGVGAAGPTNPNQLSHQLMQMGMGGPGYSTAGPLGGGRLMNLGAGDMGARPWGQKISSHDKLNEWKLFVGQVPLEATERDLFTLFGPIGDIVELYILRNNNGKSRGCAFVTYSTKPLAQQAITQLNGKQVPPGKTLVVKFADRASAAKGSGVGASISAPLMTPSGSAAVPPASASAAVSAAPAGQFFS